MKLRTKFALLVAICTLLLLGSYYLLSIYNANNAIINFAQQSSVTIGDNMIDDDDLVAAINQQSQLNNADELLSFLTTAYPGHHFVVFHQGKVVTESFTSDDLAFSYQAEENGKYSYTLKSLNYSPIVIGANRPPEQVQVQSDSFGLFWLPKSLITQSEQGQSLRQQINNHFTNALLVLSGLAILLSWLGAWYFLKPLKDIKQRFKALADGQLDTRISLKRNDEIGEIIVSFNQLAQWLQTLHRQYKQMSSDLAHELKTPLTSMQSRIEALEDGIIKADSEQYALLSKDIKTINKIVEDLCLLSLTESKQLTLDIESVHLASLTKEIYQGYQLKAQQLEIAFDLELDSNSCCLVDKQRFTQVLTNLIENGFKYGLDGKSLKLAVTEEQRNNQDFVKISVIDKGIGLNETQQEQVFDRFYRTQSSRHDKNSLGLGLPICKQLTELMLGELVLTSTPNQGCRFDIYLRKQ